MVNKVTDLVYKSLTTNIAPMVYIMMFVNILIGLFFATGWFMAGNESILYNTGVLVDRQIWGGGAADDSNDSRGRLYQEKSKDDRGRRYRWVCSMGLR